MKILSVIGARPQFIKAAALSNAMRNTPGVNEILVHTGQHYDANMSDVFFEELDIPKPAHHLGIGGGRHGKMTGKMLEGVEKLLLSEKPDALLVYGDTNSTLAGALAAAKLHIPVAHVEAGLRSFNRKMPEEINRVLTDHVSEWLFCPTETAVKNLKTEGVAERKIRLVGDVMYDGAVHFSKRAEKKSDILRRLKLEPRGYVLTTIHRAENTDDPKRLTVMLQALGEIAEKTPIVLPLHPRTRGTIASLGLTLSPKIVNTEPVGYLDMILLEKNAQAIATDSGGVQKEAFFFRVPCITLRDETEWVELVELGWNRIVPPTAVQPIVEAVLKAQPSKKPLPADLYGGGRATQSIVHALLKGP